MFTMEPQAALLGLIDVLLGAAVSGAPPLRPAKQEGAFGPRQHESTVLASPVHASQKGLTQSRFSIKS